MGSENELCTMLMNLTLESENQLDERVTQIITNFFAHRASPGSLPAFISALSPLIADDRDEDLRLAGTRALGLVVPAVPYSDLHCHLQSLVDLAHGRLKTDPSTRVRSAAALSVAALAEATAPGCFQTFLPLLRPLWVDMATRMENYGEVLAGFLIAMCSIIGHMDQIYASYYANEVLSQVFGLVYKDPPQLKIVGECDGNSIQTLLKIVGQCVDIPGPDVDSAMQTWFLSTFVNFFWSRATVPVHASHYQQLLDVTVLVAKRAGLSALFKTVAGELMKEDRHSWRYSCKVMELVGKAVDAAAPHQELLLEMDQLFTSPPL